MNSRFLSINAALRQPGSQSRLDDHHYVCRSDSYKADVMSLLFEIGISGTESILQRRVPHSQKFVHFGFCHPMAHTVDLCHELQKGHLNMSSATACSKLHLFVYWMLH
jgi:hypothetical protein